MSRQQHTQPIAPDGQQEPRALNATNRPRQLRGWRTVKELREELRFPSDDACRQWLRRSGIKSVRRGKRTILVDGLDVDRVLMSA